MILDLPCVHLILATDDIVEEVRRWNDEFFGESFNEDAEQQSSNCSQVLADRLAKLARERSLDTSRDSPFALLAKENDVLWNLGGKPDDTAVVVTKILRK